jgi:hypothetical protein
VREPDQVGLTRNRAANGQQGAVTAQDRRHGVPHLPTETLSLGQAPAEPVPQGGGDLDQLGDRAGDGVFGSAGLDPSERQSAPDVVGKGLELRHGLADPRAVRVDAGTPSLDIGQNRLQQPRDAGLLRRSAERGSELGLPGRRRAGHAGQGRLDLGVLSGSRDIVSAPNRGQRRRQAVSERAGCHQRRGRAWADLGLELHRNPVQERPGLGELVPPPIAQKVGLGFGPVLPRLQGAPADQLTQPGLQVQLIEQRG